MRNKKWYLKRNISCDAHLLSELLETDVHWDDAIVMAAGKLRKLWDSLSELRSSLYERQLERPVLRPALLPVKTAPFTQFFPSIMTSHSKIEQFNWEAIGRFRKCVCLITEPRALLCKCKGNCHSWLLCQQLLALWHSWQDYVSELRRHKLLKFKLTPLFITSKKIDLCKLTFSHRSFTFNSNKSPTLLYQESNPSNIHGYRRGAVWTSKLI